MKTPFQEHQRFTQWWLWLGLIMSSTAIIGSLGYAMYTQLYLGLPWGAISISDEALLAVAVLLTTAAIGSLLVYYTAMLELRVDDEGLSYRFAPFIRGWRKISKRDIMEYHIVKRLTGKHSVHFGLSGTFTAKVRGRVFLELLLSDNRVIRLGTQSPDQLMLAMKSMMRKKQ